MSTGKIIVAGIGPGSESDITPAVLSAIRQSDVIVGYKYYFRFIEKIIRPGAICIDSGMKREKARAEEAYNYATEGKVVTVISSGDAGIYGMAPLIYEMKREKGSDISIEALPGISAFQKAASLLGAPVGHDFCVISLSDLMTPWELIEKRIKAAASADFITAIYNPKSEGRYWQLYRLIEIFLQERDPQTPVGFVRQAGREEQEVTITTLADFDPEQVDMFTVILIGNSQTYQFENKMITPRGYYGEIKMAAKEIGIGQDIMIRSFRTIEKELKNQDIPLEEMGLAACHPYNSRFRYGKCTAGRRQCRFYALRKTKQWRSPYHHHRCHHGSIRYPQRSFATHGTRSEMLPARRENRCPRCRKRDHPHTSRHTDRRQRASGCSVRIW